MEDNWNGTRVEVERLIKKEQHLGEIVMTWTRAISLEMKGSHGT